jgi:hypothetical protein
MVNFVQTHLHRQGTVWGRTERPTHKVTEPIGRWDRENSIRLPASLPKIACAWRKPPRRLTAPCCSMWPTFGYNSQTERLTTINGWPTDTARAATSTLEAPRLSWRIAAPNAVDGTMSIGSSRSTGPTWPCGTHGHLEIHSSLLDVTLHDEPHINR